MQDGKKTVWIHFCDIFFQGLKQNIIAYRSSKVSSRPVYILKFTRCDNQDLVGCIPIATVTVHLHLNS